MQIDFPILMLEALAVYLIVLWTHSLRRRFGLAHFYALLGALTAVMSWITDAGVSVRAAGLTFMVGSTVFYTALLLGVFVIYVFDGPRATRVAISTIAGVSILVPVIAVLLHLQTVGSGDAGMPYIPTPSLRTNVASVVATVLDMVFLAVVWEYLGKPRLRIGVGLRAFMVLLGVMWLDVGLFATGAFLGSPDYARIVKATLASRLAVSLFAWPFLRVYLIRQSRIAGAEVANRPVLAILKEAEQVRGELDLAREEVAHRQRVEREKEALLQAIPLPVFSMDRTGLFLDCNRAFETIAGRPRAEIVGRTVGDIVAKACVGDYTRWNRELLEQPGSRSYECRIVTAAGDAREVVFSKATFGAPSAGVAGLVGVIVDLTERKHAEMARVQMEQELRQQHKLAAIGTLARGVAHEINNPIMGMINYAQLIQDRLDDDSPLHEYATEIMREGDRVGRIVRAMLSLSQPQTFARTPADIRDIVGGVLPLITAMLKLDQITLRIELAEGLPPVVCQTQQIQEVLMALLANAREALDERGPGAAPDKLIVLSARLLPGVQAPRSRDAPRPARCVRVTVEDHGAGIPPELTDRVFEPFFTTKSRSEHAGLSLSTSLAIVRDHAGRLSFESEPGRHTRFHLDLPADGVSA